MFICHAAAIENLTGFIGENDLKNKHRIWKINSYRNAQIKVVCGSTDICIQGH